MTFLAGQSGRPLRVALASLAWSTLFATLSALTPTPPNLLPLIGVASLLGLVIWITFLAAALFVRVRPYRPDRWRAALAFVLLIAASFHLLFLGEHAEESPLLGLGFLASGLVQVGLAAVVIVRPHPLAYYGVIALNVALIALYAAHVVVGLPLTPSAQSGFTLGPTEAVDAVGLATAASELIGLAFAFALFHARGRDSSPSPARQVQQQAGG